MILRPPSQNDYATLRQIRQDPALLDMVMSYPAREPVSRAAADGWIAERTADQSLILRVIVDERDRALGYVQITGLHRKGGFAWFGIALSPKAQGRGAGRAAMDALVDIGHSELNLRKLLCEVRADNARAIALYEAIGFTRAGTLKGHYRDLGGRWQDVHIFERILP